MKIVQYEQLSVRRTAVERQAARLRANNINNSLAEDMDMDYDNCTMIVMDGIVFAPKVKCLKYLVTNRDLFLFLFSTVQKMGALKIL
jgi:hypothetical protein